MTKKQLRVVDEVLDLAIEGDLNKALNKALSITLLTGNNELAHWIECETNGYYETNESFTSAPVRVPVYRKLAGIYYTKDGRKITDYYNDIDFMNFYYVREGISEIESMSKSDKRLSFKNARAFKFLSEKFNVEIEQFTFTSNALIGVIQSVRNKLIKEFVALKRQYSETVNLLSHSEEMKILRTYHSSVVKNSEQYFEDGHYRSAILDTYIALVNEVKSKSNISDKDGSSLMDAAFSVGNSNLKVSDDRNEQLGALWLFKGAVMFLRNTNAHKVQPWEDSQKTLEWLGFASALFHTLDNSQTA